jgi:hypothetical protein
MRMHTSLTSLIVRILLLVLYVCFSQFFLQVRVGQEKLQCGLHASPWRSGKKKRQLREIQSSKEAFGDGALYNYIVNVLTLDW